MVTLIFNTNFLELAFVTDSGFMAIQFKKTSSKSTVINAH